MTTALSQRAVRQIKGAAIKAENLGRRLGTFITFTVRAEEREDFASGEVVLGREMRRVLNAMKQWQRRSGGHGFVYIWAAENVRNDNPHVHLLTDFSVPRSEFESFAGRIESLWGHGFAHVERVRNPKQAGRYLMKALRYTLKAAKEDQGRVIGNRYGIAREILPRYEVWELYECADAARGLRHLQATVTDEVEQLADGLWLTRFGLAFVSGTRAERIHTTLEHLADSVRQGQ